MFIGELFENNDDLFAERWYSDDQVQNLIRKCFTVRGMGNGIAREWMDRLPDVTSYSHREVLDINNDYAQENDIPFRFTNWKWNADHDELMWTLSGAVPKLNEEDDEDLFAPSTLSKHLPDILADLQYISTKMLEEPWGYLENLGYDEDELSNEEYDQFIELTMEAGEIYQDLTNTFRTKGIIRGIQQLDILTSSENSIAAGQAHHDIDGLSNDYDIDIGRYINEENDDDLFAENKPVKVMRAVAKQMQIAKDWVKEHNTDDTTIGIEHIEAIKRSIKICAEIIQAIRVGGIDAGVKVWYKEFYSRAYSGMPGAAELADVGLNIMYHVKEETGIDFLTSHYRFAEGMTETRIINAERVDVYYRPVIGSRGRRVVARNIPAAALEPLLKKLSEKYAVPVESFEWSAAQDIAENFADGKNPGRKGLAKRSGVNTKASVSTLRNVAKHSTGEKQRMAHWLANMKSGRAKASKVKEDAAGVGVVKNSKDPRYVMATTGDQNDVTADTMPKAMRAYGLIGRKSPGQRGKKQ